jgi:hypothetical protein
VIQAEKQLFCIRQILTQMSEHVSASCCCCAGHAGPQAVHAARQQGQLMLCVLCVRCLPACCQCLSASVPLWGLPPCCPALGCPPC